MLADYSFYTGPFGGSSLSEGEFNRWEPAAERYLHTITFGRLMHAGTVSDPVRMAICELSEVISRQEKLKASVVQSGKRSETVGSYSVTYEDARSSEVQMEREKYDAAGRYLLATGLMDRGLRRVCKC